MDDHRSSRVRRQVLGLGFAASMTALVLIFHFVRDEALAAGLFVVIGVVLVPLVCVWVLRRRGVPASYRSWRL